MVDFCNEQIFVITGASSGIGRATALLLNERGAKVIGIGTNLDALYEVQRISAYPQNFFVEVYDLMENIPQLSMYIQNLKNKYGKLSGLVCCAGKTKIQPLQILDYQQTKELFDLNYYVPLFLAKGIADKRNHTEQCSIIFISSIEAIVAGKGMTAYAGTKAAIAAASKSLAKELAKSKVRVNAILPGDVRTPMTESIDGLLEQREPLFPLGIGKPYDIATLCAFLLSEDAQWITGKNYIIDGGYL